MPRAWPRFIQVPGASTGSTRIGLLTFAGRSGFHVIDCFYHDAFDPSISIPSVPWCDWVVDGPDMRVPAPAPPSAYECASSPTSGSYAYRWLDGFATWVIWPGLARYDSFHTSSVPSRSREWSIQGRNETLTVRQKGSAVTGE